MGRPIFSHTYAAASPAVRTEPEPKVDTCEKWSVWNRFDPDSDEFFENAEYEAFIDPAQLAAHSVEIPVLAEAEGQSDTSDSSDGGASDEGSPMAVGSDDPAVLIADAYAEAYTAPSTSWEDFTQWRTRGGPPLFAPHSPVANQSTPPFIPPSISRESSPGLEVVPLPADEPPRSPTLRRAVNITPIVISRIQTEATDRSPSPETPDAPSTPPTHATPLPQSSLVTPSPPPSLTPRIYSWRRQPSASPTSPSRIRGNWDGPLTNPHARMSFARIEATPVRIRIPSSVM